MSRSHHKGVFGRRVPTTTTSSFSFKNGKTVRETPNSSPNFPHTLPNPALEQKPGPPALVCPVPNCPSVFKGERSRGYLWRHLKRPRISRRTGGERSAWLHLHKIEHDRLVAAG
ncbi:hypothetical protein HOY80DRAFT_1140467, partial [Tuber brumale]